MFIVEVLQQGRPTTYFQVCENLIFGSVPPHYKHLTLESAPGSTREEFLRAAIRGTQNRRDLRTGNGMIVRESLPEIEPKKGRSKRKKKQVAESLSWGGEVLAV